MNVSQKAATAATLTLATLVPRPAMCWWCCPTLTISI